MSENKESAMSENKDSENLYEYSIRVMHLYEDVINKCLSDFKISTGDYFTENSITPQDRMNLSVLLDNLRVGKEAELSGIDNDDVRQRIADKYKFLMRVTILAYCYMESRRFVSVQPFNHPVQLIYFKKYGMKVETPVVDYDTFISNARYLFTLCPDKFKAEYGISQIDNTFNEQMEKLYEKVVRRVKVSKTPVLTKGAVEVHRYPLNISDSFGMGMSCPELEDIVYDAEQDFDKFKHEDGSTVNTNSIKIVALTVARKLDNLVMMFFYDKVLHDLYDPENRDFNDEYQICPKLTGVLRTDVTAENKSYLETYYDCSICEENQAEVADERYLLQEEKEKLCRKLDIITYGLGMHMPNATVYYILANSHLRTYFENLAGIERRKDVDYDNIETVKERVVFNNIPVYFFNDLNNISASTTEEMNTTVVNRNMLIVGKFTADIYAMPVIICPYILAYYDEKSTINEMSIEKILCENIDFHPDKQWYSQIGFGVNKDAEHAFGTISIKDPSVEKLIDANTILKAAEIYKILRKFNYESDDSIV